MPFGLTNAPATFQALMNDVFRSYLRQFVLVFFDDILIYSKTTAEHVSHLSSVLATLQTCSLVVSRSKCAFGVEKVAWTQKFERIEGFFGHHQKFIWNYAHIAKPLTDQPRRNAYGWNMKALTTFTTLKQAMTQAPILSLIDFTKNFLLKQMLLIVVLVQFWYQRTIQ